MPVAFELTVLFAAFAMVIAFFVSNKLGPAAKAVIHDERITDDRFLVVVKVGDGDGEENIKEIELALAEAGAEGITLKV